MIFLKNKREEEKSYNVFNKYINITRNQHKG